MQKEQANISYFPYDLQVIGGGLAGSEAAWQAANRGLKVAIYEMRGGEKGQTTPAHQTAGLAELVCSNSFRSDDIYGNAVGLLHEEMRRCGSLILQIADRVKVPAGGALAVDREQFSKGVQAALEAHPNITIIREEISQLPEASTGQVIIATGPLTSDALSKAIAEEAGKEHLAFFDAIAPIVHKDSIDFSKAWFQSRYDKPGPGGTGKDYINCPMSQAQYEAFWQAICDGEKTEFKAWEKDTPYFEGCLPIEVMAERGIKTLAFGPMKPVGLTNPNSDEAPYAVVQLRQDNALGTLYNMVGFQTKLKYAEQMRIFRMIPGLEQAEFARLGGIHRNCFIHSPSLLTPSLQLKPKPHIRFAGQVTGVEGYVESSAIGLLAGRFVALEKHGNQVQPQLPPADTALGALLHHITLGFADGEQRDYFQPMNVNFGLFPPLAGKCRKKDRKRAYAERALDSLTSWLAQDESLFAPLPLPQASYG